MKSGILAGIGCNFDGSDETIDPRISEWLAAFHLILQPLLG
jgi:hypothetical protein